MAVDRMSLVQGLRTAVDRDGLRSRSTDEQRQLELCQIMWSMRHLVLVTAFVDGVLEHGLEGAERLVLVALVSQIVAHASVRRWRGLARTVTIVDAVLLVGFAALGLPTFLVLVMSVGILGWAATFRPIAAISAAVVVLVAVATTYVRRHDEITAATGLGAFGLLGCIFVIRTVRMNMGARRASEREQLVSDSIDAILWESLPGEPTAIKVSAAARRMLGHPEAEWLRRGFVLAIAHDDERDAFERHVCGHTDGSITVRLGHTDGSYRWMEYRATWVVDRVGRRGFAVGVLLDRTEQVEAEREALAFGHLVTTSPIGQVLLRCTPSGPVVEAMNRAVQSILGTDAAAIGRRLDDLGRPGLRIDDLLALVPVDAATDTIEFAGADGRIHQATLRRVDDRSCSIDFLDVTERVEAGARLHAQARQDELTGLPNRRAFIESLEQRLEDRGSGVGAVVIVDLDEFKDINDSLGHETGDHLLREIGRRIVAHVGPGDMVARLGGDEFALLLDPWFGDDALTDAASEDRRSVDAVERANRLVDAINDPVLVGDLRLRVRGSAGVVLVPAGSDRQPCERASAAELLRCADVAMYAAKGQDAAVVLYDPLSDRADRERVAMVAALEVAIAGDQLVLHHQPLFDVPSGRLIGSETLARWNHPTLGLVPPDTFISLAEVSGQMKVLTRWVIRRSLADLVLLGDAGRGLEVSVNLSVRNLYEVDLVEWIAMTLDGFGVDPARLVVEITESTVMDDQSAAIETIQGLRDLGVRTWIDDFGTGHSSFARLRTLPVDGVKIDRSFVSGTLTSSNDRIVLRSMVELVGALGMRTVAEGVEDIGTMGLLREIGCTTAQGFGLARPMPFDDFRALVTRELGSATTSTASLVASS